MSIYNFEDLIAKWQCTTDTANELYQRKEHQHAVSLYEQSLFYSELMFRHAEEADTFSIQVVSPFSVSCINLANNYRAGNDFERAGAYFMYNVWQIKMLSKKESITEKLYWDCIHNWEKAVLELSAFYQETEQPLTMNFWKDETYTKIQQAKAVIGMQQTSMN